MAQARLTRSPPLNESNPAQSRGYQELSVERFLRHRQEVSSRSSLSSAAGLSQARFRGDCDPGQPQSAAQSVASPDMQERREPGITRLDWTMFVNQLKTLPVRLTP